MHNTGPMPPVWKMKTQGHDDQVVIVQPKNNDIVIQQDWDILIVTAEEAKELVHILQSVIDYKEEE